MDYNIPNPPNPSQNTQTPPPSSQTPPPGGHGTFDPPPGVPTYPPPDTYQPPQKSYHGMAVASLVLGLIAYIIPIPVFDIIAGVVGILLGGIAMQGKGRMAVAGLVTSIFGTISAITFTLGAFDIVDWSYYLTSLIRLP